MGDKDLCRGSPCYATALFLFFIKFEMRKIDIKNKKQAIEYCINKGFNKEESESIVNNLWDYCSEIDSKPTIDKLDNEIGYFTQEKELKKQAEEWKNRLIWKKIVFGDDGRVRNLIGLSIGLIVLGLMLCIPFTYSFLRTCYIGKECPLGTEPSWSKRSCVEVVCNGEAIRETGYGDVKINESRLFFLNTFIYKNSENPLITESRCVSKCADLDEEYYQNYIIPTKTRKSEILMKGQYYYWKDGQCILLPKYKNTLSKNIKIRRQKEDKIRELENKELSKKIEQEEDTLKEHFLRILEEKKDYYKNAHYNH